MPKKLSEKEKKRREEMKRLKDLENVEKIQKKLFKDRPGKNINDNEDFEENINNMSVKIEERKRNDEFDDYQEKKVDTIKI